jgi:AcrR family transcriptional regulator
MPRLTRAESQAHTRDRLIATATALFLRDGYAQTSLDKVAKAAGHSKGAVYSNFRNKDELCLAALNRIRGQQNSAMISSLDAAGEPDKVLRAFASWWASTAEDESWMVLETEYLAHARRDPELRRELAARNAEVHRTITALLAHHLQRCGVELPLPTETMATALMGMSIGLTLLHSVDDQVDLGALPAMVRAVITAGRVDAARHPAAGRH